MADSTLAFDILARDHASSAFDKVARSADKTAASLKKSAKISDDVAKAEARLSKAHDAESDSLGRVRVAEQKLAEVRGNSNAKTSQVARAEEQLSAARRKAAQASNTAKTAEDSLGKARAALAKNAEDVGKDTGHSFGKGFGDGVDKEGAKSGKNFNQSLKKWLSPSTLGKAGEEGGTVFGSGFLGALKTPVLGPALVGALGAAVAIAAPAVGAIAAGGIVAGFGAGIAGLGIVFAAKSKAVQDTWKKTLSGMGAQMALLSKPFESTLISIAGFAQRTFSKFAPALGAAFKGLAPVVTKFVDQFARGLERLQPAIRPLSDAFAAVLASLGPAMQGAIGKVSEGLIKLADSVKKNPDGLADMVTGVGNLTNKALDLVTALNNMNGAFERLTGGTSLADIAFGGANTKIGQFLGTVKNAVNPLGGVTNGVSALAGSADKSATSVADLGKKATLTGGAASDMGAKVAALNAATKGVAGASNAANNAARALAATFDRQAAATQKSNDALTRQSNLLLTLSGSQIDYQQAVIDATAAVKENGKTHDIATQKGINNKRALDQVAASAQAQTIAMRNAGDGNVSAAKHAEGAQKSFIKLATQMGYTVPQAKAMAQSLIKIPNVTRTAKLQANKKDLETKLAQAKTALADPKISATKKAKLTAEIANLQAGIARAKAALAGVPNSKTVTITTKYVTVGSRSSGAGVGGGHENNTRATGGPVKKGVPYWVGEKGPEPFIPDQNGMIIPNHKVKSGGATAFAGGSSGTTINVYVSGALDSSDAADKIVNKLRKYVRVNGGDVQKVIGR